MENHLNIQELQGWFLFYNIPPSLISHMSYVAYRCPTGLNISGFPNNYILNSVPHSSLASYFLVDSSTPCMSSGLVVASPEKIVPSSR